MFNGLSDKEVSISRSRYGNNEIIKHKKNTLFKLVIESLNDPIIKILLIALGIKILFLFNDSDVFEIAGIILAILVSSIISSISEYGSEKAFEKLASENSKLNSKVIRNGKMCIISIDNIVVGDIVKLSAGDRIPADGVIISGSVYVDEAMLTGETKEKYKGINEKVFRGSVITLEEGIMKVTGVGINTFYGSIADSIQEDSPDSPLKNRLKVLAKFISKIGYICAFLVIISYLFNVIVIKNNFDLNRIINFVTSFDLIGPHLLYSLTLAVTVIVVSVPEGLPMMITLVLSSNMKRMLKNNVLVRKLVGIESAGSINILFSDKTGTITKGELEVVGFVSVSNKLYKTFDAIKNEKLKNLVYISSVYNNASSFENNSIVGGNSTDKSNLKFIGLSDKSKHKIISKKVFNSNNKYSSVTLDNSITYYKGAFEVFKDKIKYYYDDYGNKVLTKDLTDLYKSINDYTASGTRVLCFVTSSTNSMTSLCLLGFALMKDEVRKEAIVGIELVTSAGIHTVMITGDSLNTAFAVAKEVGLITETSITLTSEEMSKMNDEELKRIIPKLSLVARSLPEDKKRLVLLSQELGLVSGMTGDGVNDAPALKKADVGFAMGSGTEVAKEVSDIVILDNNFLSIAKSILFGRTIFKSIRKFIIFQLTVNFCALSISFIGPLIGVSSPVTVIQMLWINMVMDTLAGIAFSFEPPLKEYMIELPKEKDEHIINKYMINEIIVTGLFLSILYLWFLKSPLIHDLFRIGENDKYLMTAFFGLFIFSTIFNAFNARTHRLNIFANLFKNKAFLIVISFVAIVELFLIYFGGEIFRTTGLTFIEFEIMLFLAVCVIPFDFIRKTILKRKNKCTGV